MKTRLELLAPARNKDIGIAAIDCGADAVYMAGPAFGAREAAGNTLEDVAGLCSYAHTFGAKVYMTVNTVFYDSERQQVQEIIDGAYRSGVDAIIVQDLGILKMDLPPVALHASTQTNIRTVEQARWLASLGFERLILARELSTEQIAAIHDASGCEIEAFVHGALCVSYSGQCYLSQALTGRSANRGSCSQACRSRYDLVQTDGKMLLKDRSILSLKDLRLDGHIAEMVAAGVTSFKIEGRLKNASYIKNVVRHYREVLDIFIAENPAYEKASFGTVCGGFKPDIDATFNRGFTDLFIDGKRGDWNSLDAAKSLGEYIGTVRSTGNGFVEIDTARTVANGDGLAFITPKGEVLGARADSCRAGRITIKNASQLSKGMRVYRNLNSAFERQLENNMPQRLLGVSVNVESAPQGLVFDAACENGAKASLTIPAEELQRAENKQAALATLKAQMSKKSGIYSFSCTAGENAGEWFFPVSKLNAVRRSLADSLTEAWNGREETHEAKKPHKGLPLSETDLSYLANCANTLSRELYLEHGAQSVAPAYEIQAVPGAEVMRTKYCIKHQLGLCPKQHPAQKISEPLYLVNNSRRLSLQFDCKKCEMVVIL